MCLLLERVVFEETISHCKKFVLPFCARNFADFYFPVICKWIILRVEKIFVIVLNIPQIGSESAMFLRCFYVVNIEQLSHMFISHSE